MRIPAIKGIATLKGTGKCIRRPMVVSSGCAIAAKTEELVERRNHLSVTDCTEVK